MVAPSALSLIVKRQVARHNLHPGAHSVAVRLAPDQEDLQPVVAIAQSTKARDVLRKQAGLPAADTVAMFLKDQRRMQEAAKRGVILVDEASQIGTREMLKLLTR